MKSNDIKKRLLNNFESSRSWLLRLLADLSEHEQCIQVDELRGPLIWDLGHIAWFEELWVLRNAFKDTTRRAASDLYYDNEKNHKRSRQTMPLLRGPDLHSYMHEVRQRTLDTLAETDTGCEDPLLKNGFVYNLALNHELQHHEIMLITLQQLLARPLELMNEDLPPSLSEGRDDYVAGSMVTIPAGEFTLGASANVFAYDNERPATTMRLPAFEIDRFLTSNAEYIEFIEAGGYEYRDYWSDAGWQWIKSNQIIAPDYWRFDAKEGWIRKNFGGRISALVPDEPVMNVSLYEAEAYARFRGKRLPTESEWEKAAGFDPTDGSTRSLPWGEEAADEDRATLGATRWGPAPVWAHPAGDSPCGVRQMIGSVFEWTSSPFQPYQDFKAFPYKEYSEIFMNPQFKVLRGASWASHPLTVRNSFRNFYLPQHRNVIAGIRLAKSL